MTIPVKIQHRQKIRHLLIFLLVFRGFTTEVPAQTYEICIGMIDDDEITAVAPAPDGGFILGGTVLDSITLKTDNMLMRVSPLGEMNWAVQWGLPAPDESPASVEVTPGGVILVAENLGSSPYLSKWNLSGEPFWSKTIPGSFFLSDMTLMGDTAYGLCGTSGFQAAVCATDTAGTILWQKALGGPDLAHYTSGQGVTCNNVGGLTVCGRKDIYLDPGICGYLAAVKAGGVFWWQKMHGEIEHTEFARKVIQMPDNNYLFIGFHSSSYMWPTNGNGILVKTNSVGSELWAKYYGGAGDESFVSFDTVAGGGFICCGTTNTYGAGLTDVWLVRTDINGDTLWTRTFGGAYEDVGVYVKSMPDGGFFVAGHTNSFWNEGFDFYLIRTDADGRVGEPGKSNTPLRIPLIPGRVTPPQYPSNQ